MYVFSFVLCFWLYFYCPRQHTAFKSKFPPHSPLCLSLSEVKFADCTVAATTKAPPFQHIWDSGRLERHIPTTPCEPIWIIKSYTWVGKRSYFSLEDYKCNSSTPLWTACSLNTPPGYINATPNKESNNTYLLQVSHVNVPQTGYSSCFLLASHCI